jgi:predicted amidohydrolase YtcJ
VKADVVLTSNAIFTDLSEKPFKGAIAIKENKIIAVGTAEEISELIGEATKIYT